MKRRFLNYINSEKIDLSKPYFYIEALEDGLTAKLSANAEYCVDNGSWATLSFDNNTVSINKGQTLSFRATLTPNSISGSGIGTFTISKKCNVKGNIMSLLYGDDFIDKIDLTGKNFAFYELFNNCTNIVNASELILPATTLADFCYDSMFKGCTSLVNAPELPATSLASGCYNTMFKGCTSLVNAPELPATTLAKYCYDSMFYGCTSLISAPEVLPATTLASSCYSGMFQGCTKLETAPSLPATTLANYCYNYMFKNCTSLTTAPELPATTLADECYQSMFEGCTGLTTAPELPATTLANYCYNYMFKNCTSLTTAPELPATTLVNYCYYCMFYGTNVLPDCSNIDFTKHNNGGLQGLFAGTKVTDSDLERILPKNSNGKYCLPATTLATGCYGEMFMGCKSLTTAPELPATYVASGSYNTMFYGCKNLNYIKMLATDMWLNSPSSCLNNWVNSVASTGTFVKHPDMTRLPSGVNGIPSGWTVEDYVETNLITFTIDNVTYQAEEGMTWGQWVNSEYNTRPFYTHTGKSNIYIEPFVNDGVTRLYFFVLLNSTAVTLTDVIIENNIYNSNGSELGTGKPRTL